jgi:tetratricopeptide (TPR) repeat protein
MFSTRYAFPLGCFALLVACLLSAGGCHQELRPYQLAEASAAYQAGEFEQAFRDASAVADFRRAENRDEAALVAGMAARQLDNPRRAERYLLQAAFSDDGSIAGEALASLGLMYAEREEYDRSADALLKAAPRLTGQDRANAYFYAAIAQQKMGQWAQARTNLVLARAASADSGFRERVNEQLAVVGYTLQLGAYRDPANAQRRADELSEQADAANLGRPRVAQTTDRAGATLSVVQVGQFSTFQSAMQARDALGINEVVIVPLASQ